MLDLGAGNGCKRLGAGKICKNWGAGYGCKRWEAGKICKSFVAEHGCKILGAGRYARAGELEMVVRGGMQELENW